MQRQRFKHATSLAHRLKQFATSHREAADKLMPSPERDELMKKVGQAETASQIDEWLNRPGLQPPRR